jgi:chaperonin cofactor prefoldin
LEKELKKLHQELKKQKEFSEIQISYKDQQIQELEEDLA